MQVEPNEYPVLTEMLAQDMNDHEIVYRHCWICIVKCLLWTLLPPLVWLCVVFGGLVFANFYEEAGPLIYLSIPIGVATLFVACKFLRYLQSRGMSIWLRFLLLILLLFVIHAISALFCAFILLIGDKALLIAGFSAVIVLAAFVLHCWFFACRFVRGIPATKIEATKVAIAAFQNREWYRGVSLAHKAIVDDIVLDAYLIICSAFGLGGMPKDPRHAFERAAASARRRSLIHMRILAWMYYVGIGTEKDEIRATELLNEYRLARQGGVSD